MQPATGTGKYERLLERCKSLAPVPTAVAHPCEETALTGAIEAADAVDRTTAGWAGEQDRRDRSFCRSRSRRSGNFDVPHSHAAAVKAVELFAWAALKYS